MKINIFSALVLALTTTQIRAAITSSEIVTDLTSIAQIADETNESATKLSVLVPANISTTVARTLANLQRIVNGVNDEVVKLSHSSPLRSFSRVHQNDICKAFGNFADSQVSLYQTLVTKGPFFLSSPIPSGIYGLFSKLLSMVDAVAEELSGLAPICSNNIQSDLASLDDWIRSVLFRFQDPGTN